MGYNCGDCGDTEHACLGWNGKGSSCDATFTGINHSLPMGKTFPNHNLKDCPPQAKECQYRLKKTPSQKF